MPASTYPTGKGRRATRPSVALNHHRFKCLFYDQAKGGMSYCSAQDPRIYFGLGNRARVDSLEILWSSGARDLLRNINADQIITVEEGKGITPYRYPSLKRSK